MPISQLDRKKRDLMLRRSDILRAAERVFALKGYYQATVADIAQEAQYGVGTLYLYFKDKQSMHASLFEEKMKQLLALVKERVEKEDNAFEKIKILVEAELEFFTVNENFFKIFFLAREDLQRKIEGEIPAAVIDLMFELLDYIANLVKQTQSQGIIRNDYPPQKIASILQSIIRSIILPRLLLKAKQKEDLSKQSSFVLDVFLHGVGTK